MIKNLIKNWKMKKDFKKTIKKMNKDVKEMIRNIDELILSKKHKKLLKKAYKKGEDIFYAENIFGWEWEGDHFHKPDGTVIYRSDYL